MSQPKVLVVEDDLLVLHLSAKALKDGGLDVVEANSVEAAVDILREPGSDIAVVFSNILTTRELDGLALAHTVRADWPDIPVVLTSGLFIPLASALPADTHFFPKPYDLRQVSALIIELADGTTRPDRDEAAA